MYAFIEGEIVEKSVSSVVIRPEGLGVGFLVNIAPRTSQELPGIGESGRLFTSFQVRSESQALYGFETPAERDLFEALLKISGVGGKTALAILDLPRERIVEAIALGDSDALRQAQGVGPKTAARIVLELKDRFAEQLMEEWAVGAGASLKGTYRLESQETPTPGDFSEAVEALVELGFQRYDARERIRKSRSALGENAGTEDLVRWVLRHSE